MRSRTLLVALGCWLLAGPLSAQEDPQDFEGVGPEADAEVQDDARMQADVETPAPDMEAEAPGREGAPLLRGRLSLSLAEAIEMGLENNLDVQVELYGPLIAEMDKKVAWGAYDPTLFAEFGYLDAKQPSASSFAVSGNVTQRTTDGKAGLRGILPLLGTEYEARFEAAKDSTDLIIDSLIPEYTSGWAVDVRQPLLKDLIWSQPWLQVRTSRLALDSSREGFRRAVMDTVEAIETAYWTLIAQDEARRVAQKSLETAKALLDQTETQYEVGVVSRVEVTEAEAGLSQREVSLIRAENQYRNQQDVLINLVLGRGLRANSSMEITPTDRPQDYIEYQVDVESAVSSAFENRPELVEARKRIETQQVQLAFERNQWLPSLDGVFSMSQSGLAGRANPLAFSPPSPGSIGGYGDSFDDYEDNPVYVARGVLSVPFPNTAASGKVHRTRFALQQAEVQKTRLEQDIVIQVRQAARNLEAAQEGIDAARDAQAAAEEQLRAERIRLEYGESTPFDVLQREEDLVDRENQLIGAFQAYRTSVTALDRAQGTILRNRNIRIDQVGALR